MSKTKRKPGYPRGQVKAVDNETHVLLKLLDKREFAELEIHARRVLSRIPNHPFALKALSAALISQEKATDALTETEHALRMSPGDLDLRCNLGLALSMVGRHTEGIDILRELLAAQPLDADLHANLGNALLRAGRIDEAIDQCSDALDSSPAHFGALHAKGIALLLRSRPGEAIPVLARALELNPESRSAFFKLVSALLDTNNFLSVIPILQDFLASNPDDGEALASLRRATKEICLWDTYSETTAQLKDFIHREKLEGIVLFDLLSTPGLSGSELLKCARYRARQPVAGRAFVNREHERLRIGYLSSDFHNHATCLLMGGLLKNHDRTSFEVFAYSYGPDDNSEMRQRIVRAFDMFREIGPLPDAEAAALILRDEIDILVDLKGWTKGSRMGIAAQRPAPIIANWLGYPGTYGLAELADYLIGDPIVTPLEHAADYTETLALMPHCYQPNDATRPIGPRSTRAEANLPEEGCVFCCFNQTYKITPEFFSLWCRLLQQVDGSVLWLWSRSEAAIVNLRREAEKRGIAPSRLIFGQALQHSDHLARLQLADIALDTFPYNSHTTGSDALWAGVPMVTLCGDTFASRVAASLLHAVGLPELVTHSSEEYFERALDLAKHPARLGELRQRLWQARSTCHLFNTLEFTRDMERMYTAMWNDYRAGVKAPIVLKPSGKE